jgi:hypothetical protein
VVHPLPPPPLFVPPPSNSPLLILTLLLNSPIQPSLHIVSLSIPLNALFVPKIPFLKTPSFPNLPLSSSSKLLQLTVRTLSIQLLYSYYVL